ncbi:MAG TPA: helix-turn-helix transcriptional regulator [Kineosporiaceae bacterium]|nr:helix-turn-helix transcriptional regulator [Kineosporiaceae bacterium]
MPASSSARALIAALGHRLREIREDAGLSQRDMATTLGWHSSELSKIEHGKQTPTTTDITAWCTACHTPDLVDELLAQQTLWFCSTHCRDEFAAAPQRFPAVHQAGAAVGADAGMKNR